MNCEYQSSNACQHPIRSHRMMHVKWKRCSMTLSTRSVTEALKRLTGCSSHRVASTGKALYACLCA
jgi:hypothetical protein